MKITHPVMEKICSAFLLLLLCSQLFGQTGDRIRFQQQATFGYTPALDTDLATTGIESYIDSQMTAAGPTFPFPDSGAAYTLKPSQPTLNCNNDNSAGPPDTIDVPTTCFRDSYSMYPLQKWFFQEALYGNAQLRHRVAWALSQIWVTSAFEIKQSRHMTEYYKILYKYALGAKPSEPAYDDSYRGLMKAITLSPAMGEYLDMAYSRKTESGSNIVPNENYPRELLQLFTTGVNLLEVDDANNYGKEKLVNGKPVPVYSQTEINYFARVFTGWSFCNAYGSSTDCPNARLGAMNFVDPMKLDDTRHDKSAKVLLDYKDAVNRNIPANQAGDVELDLALDNIFYHPNLPAFVSKQLIQHLVTSNPSPQYVKRVADKFINNGSNKRGDMKAVIKAILMDTEARGDSKAEPFGKLREPVQYATNIIRAFKGAGQGDGVIFKDANFLKMGQLPFYAPSVFNYYSPKNVITVDTTDLVAPEFGLMTPVTSINRANFARTVIFNGIAAVPGPDTDIPLGTSLDLTEMVNYSMNGVNGVPLVQALNTRLMNGTMPAYMQSTVLSAVTAVPKTDPAGRVKTAIYLIVTSAEFQVQR